MNERTELTMEKAELCRLLVNSLCRDVCGRADADEIGKTAGYSYTTASSSCSIKRKIMALVKELLELKMLI